MGIDEVVNGGSEVVGGFEELKGLRIGGRASESQDYCDGGGGGEEEAG